MIRGIGPVYAKKLLRAFGEKVFEVIEAEPDRLREVDGIGPVRAGRITAAWAEQKAVREIPTLPPRHQGQPARAVLLQHRVAAVPAGAVRCHAGSATQRVGGGVGVPRTWR